MLLFLEFILQEMHILMKGYNIMNVLQHDILGQKHETKKEKEKKPSMASPKNFPNITLAEGLDDIQANTNSMLTHRILEKKLIYGGLKTKQARKSFMKILKNELSIKAGILDPTTASRDSLVEFFIKRSKNL